MKEAIKGIGLSIAIGWGVGIAMCIVGHSICAHKREAHAESMKAIRDDQTEWIVLE